MRNKSVPHAATSRGSQKEVRLQESSFQPIPSWRFSTVDKGGAFAWPTNTTTELDIIQKLRQFDTMHWSNIEGPDHHFIEVSKLSKAARDRLAEIHQDDIDEIFSFHFSGKPRIIGIRDRSVVKLLWWDAEHQVCPSVKKHT